MSGQNKWQGLERIKSGNFQIYFEGKMERFASKWDVGCERVKNESKDTSQHH